MIYIIMCKYTGNICVQILHHNLNQYQYISLSFFKYLVTDIYVIYMINISVISQMVTMNAQSNVKCFISLCVFRV